jgi:DNA-binding GntR family transcriptional regulator
VARELEARIADGRHPVGSLLPPEPELAASFGVSRQTIRQAHQRLRELGLINASKRLGTRVEADRPRQAFRQSLRSLNDVFGYARETIFRVTSVRPVTVGGDLAERLGCTPGEAWIHAGGLREVPGDALPIGWTEVWLLGDYAEVLAAPQLHRTAIFEQVQQRYGIALAEIRQEISATVLDAPLARRLKSQEGLPALQIERRYLVEGGRPVELSVTTHPADRFRYGMVLRQEPALR